MLKFESKQMLAKLNKMFDQQFIYDEFNGYANYVGPISSDTKTYFAIHIPDPIDYNEELEQYYYNCIDLVLYNDNADIVNQISINIPKYCSIFCP